MLTMEEAEALGIALLDKYGLKPDHAKHVERLAMRLFDGARECGWVSESSRSLLAFAAFAHDIGHYIDEEEHHAHGAYLLMHDAALKALDDRTREAAAWLVRNHRKRKLLDEHRFRGKEREATGRLAVLLRLADALDYEHRQEAAVRIAAAGADGCFEVHVEGYDLRKYERKMGKKLAFAPEFGFERIRVVDGSGAAAEY
ncbi:HD domain-containing protein [Paenibacillus sp.]|uniref:HD domain-containing protein n=1 Tax=Paenibacillus sp. TaxID=58172 RepID=UPI002D2AF5DD|nr:HD domain-containing protein [Paenibacillus sp.]HZG87619.1 HD domain-containing protein [Paenibacillus sp.]